MFVCQFCATLPPTAPYLLHDPFVADTLFCLRKNASKSGIQGGGFANTQCGHLMCFREKNLPFTEEKESVAKRKQLLIMFSVHHCNPLFEEVGCGCLVRSVCPPLQMKKSKINLVNSQLGLWRKFVSKMITIKTDIK